MDGGYFSFFFPGHSESETPESFNWLFFLFKNQDSSMVDIYKRINQSAEFKGYPNELDNSLPHLIGLENIFGL